MSTTTNLKLFKHDNPTTNTNQFDVEKALNENWDKIDKNAGEIASKIQTLENTTSEKDTSQDTEIEVLKAENALLKSQIPSATVVGETIHLDDSSNMQCQISPIGASKQETREGYNVVNSYASLTDTTQYNTIYYKNNKMEVSKTYTISFKGKAGDMYRIPSSEYGVAVENKIITIDNDGIGKATFTTKSEFTVNSAGILQNYSANNTLPLTDICIVEGTEAKPFEEYGASPNIEFEAPIESVGDNIQLFDKDNVNVINGFFHKDNTVIVANNNRKTVYIECEQNTTYVLSTVEDIVANKMAFGYTTTIPAVGVQVYSINAIANKQLTITTGVDAKYLVAYIHSENYAMSLEEILNNLKISKGTSTGAYSPYGQGSIEVYNYTENLFDKTKTSRAIGSASGYVSTEYIPAQTGDTIAKSNATSLFLYDRTKTQITNVGNWTNKKIEVENVAYVRCNVLETEVDTFMLVKNQDLPSEYIQGQSQTKAIYTQQPFRSIGEVKDRFVKVDGVWYEKHPVYRKIFDGTEEISYISQEGNQYVFQITLPGKLLGSNDLRSSHFKVKSSVEWGEDGIVKKDDTSEYIYVYISRSDFRNWLSELYNAGTPLYVDYVLAEPLLLPCTAEQAEVLESFYTYKNITNISSDSIGELEVFYYKDLETLIGGA